MNPFDYLNDLKECYRIGKAIYEAIKEYHGHEAVNTLREQIRLTNYYLDLVQSIKGASVTKDQVKITLALLKKIEGKCVDTANSKYNPAKILLAPRKIEEWTKQLRDCMIPFGVALNVQISVGVSSLHEEIAVVKNMLLEKEAVESTITSSEVEFGKRLCKAKHGKIWEGTYNQTKVAIKTLEITQDQDALRNFRQQVLHIKKLNSDRLVRIFGWSLDDPHNLFIVMELMDGNLRDLLRGTPEKPAEPLSWSSRISMALNIAYGISVLHRANIVHRNVNSSNILHKKAKKAKVSDFSLARLLYQQSHVDRGDDLWKAPELLVTNPDFTKETDVYAFGMVLWEIASRKEPYPGIDKYELKRIVKDGQREKIESCEPETPKEFRELIVKCWDQNADERPRIDNIVKTLETIGAVSTIKNVAHAPQV